MIARPVLAALLAVLTLAPSAWAGCAWVLWSQTTWWSQSAGEIAEAWKVVAAFPNEDACERGNLAVVDARKGSQRYGPRGEPLTEITSCLPDTVDPRGPKASGR